jgi:predicted lipid-binding transport protein (Tim44 family)
MKFLSVIMVMVMLAATSSDAWAKRLGGGGSFGQQSSNVNRSAPPAQNVNRPATTPNQPVPSRPWGAMLGGLAAGLGLAWLASSLGFGEEFAQMLLLLLLGAAIVAIVLMVRRARAAAQQASSPMAFQGAGAGGRTALRDYSPYNVGNDASARPWERTSSPSAQKTEFSGNPGGSLIGSALNGPQTWGIPAGFDTEGFLRACKGNFVKLQDAWDRADLAALRAMMTDDMLTEIQHQLRERDMQSPGQANKTEVVMLEARLLGIEELNGVYMASVEFSGMIREEPLAGPNPFREVWNITRPIAGNGGWLVAGVQALQ